MRRGAKLLAAASGAAIYAAWRLWRTRRTAFDWGELPEGVELLEDMDDAVGCLTAAWTGTADADPERGFDWMLGPELAAKDDPERLRLLAWCQRFFLGLAGASGGAVLAVRRGDEVVAAVGVVPYARGLPGPVGDLLNLARALAPLALRHGLGGFAAPGFGDRFKAAWPLVDEAHRKACAGPHLHVGPVGVRPESQGRKLLSPMLRHVSALADGAGWRCYLECSGPRNAAIYGHFGYVDVGGPGLERGPMTLTCPLTGDTFDSFWSMVREPKNASEAAAEEEEKEEEKEEEVDMRGGLDMFGDGGGSDY